MTPPDCRFCRANNLLADIPVAETEQFFLLGSMDPQLPVALMIIPKRHSTTPFDLEPEEWADFGNALAIAKTYFSDHNPAGFTLGWNVGAVGGQTVAHTHLHVIPRFEGEAMAGKGIRQAFKRAVNAEKS